MILESSTIKSNIDKQKQNKAIGNVSYFFGARGTGGLFFTLFGGIAIKVFSKSSLFLLTIIFPLSLFVFIAFFFKETEEEKVEIMKKEKEVIDLLSKNIQDDKENRPNEHNSLLKNQKQYKSNSKLNESESLFISQSNSLLRAKPKSFIEDIRIIIKVFKNKNIKKIFWIVGFVMITPSFGSTWNFYFTNILKMNSEDLGDLNFMSSAGYIIGIISMNTIFMGISLKNFYKGTTLISSILLSSGLILTFKIYLKWGMDAKIFCAMNSIVSNFVYEINILPILALCCRFCPKGLEAMSYAFFMSLTWVTYIISLLFGVIILSIFEVKQNDFSNFWKCILFQTLYGLFVSAVISIMDFPENFNEQTREGENLIKDKLYLKQNISDISQDIKSSLNKSYI